MPKLSQTGEPQWFVKATSGDVARVCCRIYWGGCHVGNPQQETCQSEPLGAMHVRNIFG